MHRGLTDSCVVPLNASCFPVSSHLPDAAHKFDHIWRDPCPISFKRIFWEVKGRKSDAPHAKPVTYWMTRWRRKPVLERWRKRNLVFVFFLEAERGGFFWDGSVAGPLTGGSLTTLFRCPAGQEFFQSSNEKLDVAEGRAVAIAAVSSIPRSERVAGIGLLPVVLSCAAATKWETLCAPWV